MANEQYDFGMIGLGVMGRNLLLNMADHGFSVIGLDKDPTKIESLHKEADSAKVEGTVKIEEFINSLKKPRKFMMLVPAGAAVDAVLQETLPLLSEGDIIIDGGNSHFTDTQKRMNDIKGSGIHFMGTGISGGEKGARFGPSIMPGGDKEAYEKIKPILEAVAAKVDGVPCVTYIGPGAAGHYTKMVHNGIEYALMQVISESYDIMKRGANLSNNDIQLTFKAWNEDLLQSFLIEATAEIFKYKDDKADGDLIDHIRDNAKQKGTGKWTSQSAMDLQVPLPTIDIAVAMRDLSAYKEEREVAAKVLKSDYPGIKGVEKDKVIEDLKQSLYFSMIAIYAQGMQLLSIASKEYHYEIDPAAVAKIWRGGCIIRATMLDTIYDAYKKDNSIANLMLSPGFADSLIENRNNIKSVINWGMDANIPVPGFASAIGYFDGYRSAQLPTNLVQAQRDFFGSHTYERTDREGVFHTEWE